MLLAPLPAPVATRWLPGGRHAGAPQLQQVVGEGYQGEFSRHPGAASQQELPEALGLLDAPEHRLGDGLRRA